MKKINCEYAQMLDKNDALKKYKDEFYLPNYLFYGANGLGPMSTYSEKTLSRVSQEWKTKLLSGWFSGEIPWFYYPERVGAMQADLVGAKEKELVLAQTTTTNLHSTLAAFYKPEKNKTKVVCDNQMFSSNKYVLDAQIKLKGYEPINEIVKVGANELIINEDDIITAMTDDVALIYLQTVIHSTGQLIDIEKIAKAANEKGITIGVDCSHSVGVIEHELHNWGVDFAVWTNYKYLNGGLGCPATIFIHEKNFDVMPALPGWHGYVKSKQFSKLEDFEAEVGAGGWQHGSPNIINMAPLEGSLKMINEIGIKAIREKSLKMTEYFINLVDENLKEFCVEVVSPREEKRRSAHIMLSHIAADVIEEFLDSGSNITDDLINKIKDRQKIKNPDKKYVRIAFSPLFMSFEDVRKTLENIYELLKKSYEN